MARTRSDTISWLGCGCGSLVFLVLAAIVGLTWFGYRQGKEMERNFEDPATRTAKAREILPWRELPPGYHPMGSFSVPLLMDMAIFSDRAPDPRRRVKRDRDSAFEKSGLFYMEFHPWVSDKDELLRWLRGESKEAPGWIRRSQAQMDPEAVAHRGTLEVGGRTITYAVGRGSPNGDGAAAEPEPAPRRRGRRPHRPRRGGGRRGERRRSGGGTRARPAAAAAQPGTGWPDDLLRARLWRRPRPHGCLVRPGPGSGEAGDRDRSHRDRGGPRADPGVPGPFRALRVALHPRPLIPARGLLGCPRHERTPSRSAALDRGRGPGPDRLARLDRRPFLARPAPPPP